VIAVVNTYGGITLWNDDQKDLAIAWAQVLVGIGNRAALVDAATLDAAAVDEALRRQARVKKALKERDDY
jgi:hypothetical protein